MRIAGVEQVGVSGPLGLPIYGHDAIKKRLTDTRAAIAVQTQTVHFAEQKDGMVQGVRTKNLRYPSKLFAGANLLVAGENLSVMKRLYEQHGPCIDLIYIDPPFLSNMQYNHRGMAQGTHFSDQWADGHRTFVPWLTERIVMMHRLLKPTGSMYVHLDWHCVHYIKVEMDKIFGHDAFQREIIWRMGWVSGYKTKTMNWIRNHDNILFYTKSPKDFVFNKEYIPYEKDYVRRDGKKPTGRGMAIEDTWNCSALDRMDTIQIKSFDREKSGYSTQKNEALLARIVRASSPEGGVVADFFCGSGTTCVVAQKLGRRWMGVDCNPQAIEVAADRICSIGNQRRKSTGAAIPDFDAATRVGFAMHATTGLTRQDIFGLDDNRSQQTLSEFQNFVLDLHLAGSGRKGDRACHGWREDFGGEALVLVGPNRRVTRREDVTAMVAAASRHRARPHKIEIIAWSFDAECLCGEPYSVGHADLTFKQLRWSSKERTLEIVPMREAGAPRNRCKK